MTQIDTSVRNLSSPIKKTRYEACLELWTADSLPESAIAALELATRDPDPDVAGAAQQALAIHKTPSADKIKQIQKDRHKFSIEDWPSSYLKWLHGAILVISLFIVFLLVGSFQYSDYGLLGIFDPFFDFINSHSVWTICILFQVLIVMDMFLGILSIRVSMKKHEDRKIFFIGLLAGFCGIAIGLAACVSLLMIVTYSS